MNCGKCSVDLNLTEGYAKCNGCGSRFHHGECSVGFSTWKAKSEQAKKDWRCVSCRTEPKSINPTEDGDGEMSNNSELTKTVNESLQYFCKDNETKMSALVSDMKQYLKSHIATVNNNVMKLSQDLISKVNELCTTVSEMKSSQQKLLEENVQLRNELSLVKEKGRRGNNRNNASSRSVPKIGTKQDSGAQSVRMAKPKEPRVRHAALFVSRFDPTVTTNEIQSLLEGSSLGLSHLKITKIKTRYQSEGYYSSFHIEVLADDLPKIDCVDIWPTGCLIKPFLGRLLPDIVMNDAPGPIIDSGPINSNNG